MDKRKNKRLILHIGMIKTGSTSIQHSLGTAREALFKHNIYYPSIQPYNHVFSFPPIFVDDPAKSFGFRRTLQPNEDKYEKAQNCRQVWINEFETCQHDHFIISAEDLALPFFNKEAVRLAKEFVQPYFEEVTVIVYVRHYDTFIASHVQEVIKNGDLGTDIREVTQRFMECPPQFSYRKSIVKWIEVFGQENIVVRPFDSKAFYNGSLLADFLHALGLPADEISIPEFVTNVSLGKTAVSFINQFNHKYPLFTENGLNPDRGLAKHIFPFHLFQNIEDEKFRFDMVYTPEQAERFNEEIDFANQFFTDGYQFQRVSPGTGEMKTPDADDIPVDFIIELVNNYNKRFEFFHDRIDTLQEQNEVFREQNKTLQDQIKYYQRIMDKTGLSFFLRNLQRLPFLRAVLHKITNYESYEK